jgi:hypothetical protein
MACRRTCGNRAASPVATVHHRHGNLVLLLLDAACYSACLLVQRARRATRLVWRVRRRTRPHPRSIRSLSRTRLKAVVLIIKDDTLSCSAPHPPSLRKAQMIGGANWGRRGLVSHPAWTGAAWHREGETGGRPVQLGPGPLLPTSSGVSPDGFDLRPDGLEHFSPYCSIDTVGRRVVGVKFFDDQGAEAAILSLLVTVL